MLDAGTMLELKKNKNGSFMIDLKPAYGFINTFLMG